MSGGVLPGQRPGEGPGAVEHLQQMALVDVPPPATPARSRRSTPRSEPTPAAVDPVALVLVDTPLAHLDRPFEYLVPAELEEVARPGARVRVRFAGRDHDGFVLERRGAAEHRGRLAPLRTVVSPEPVLAPQVAAAARAVADHYGGTLAEVVRLAVPPRHARAERSVAPAAPDEPVGPGIATHDLSSRAWAAFPAGAAFLRRMTAGEAPAAVWSALPGADNLTDWPSAVADAVAAAVRGGRGAVVVVPDHRDVDRVVAAVEEVLGTGVCARLTADLGPEARYRAFLTLLRGHARVAVGTRSAAWAPVRRPGLFVCWDDGDDLHQEPRSPYPHTRQVLLERSRHEQAALLLGGYGRTVEAEAWAGAGVVARIEAPRPTVRGQAPRVVVAGEGWAQERDPAARTARIPAVALQALREGLTRGPVLVQVPRTGYVVSLTCAEPGCRTPVRCRRCEGPVGLAGTRQRAACRWCGDRPGRDAGCRTCGSSRLRAGTVGAARTAEELGRAFPGVRVVSSGGDHVLAGVDGQPALVVATPGAEPPADGGYDAVVLLDGWRLLDRASLDAGVEALRRWLAAAALVGPERGGRPPAQVVLCGVPAHAGVPAVEALVRWDPVGLAARELLDRTALGLPPVRRHVCVRGPLSAVRQVVEELGAAGHEPLGEPSPTSDQLASAVLCEGVSTPLAAAVRQVRGARSASKAGDLVRLVLDATEPLA